MSKEQLLGAQVAVLSGLGADTSKALGLTVDEERVLKVVLAGADGTLKEALASAKEITRSVRGAQP